MGPARDVLDALKKAGASRRLYRVQITDADVRYVQMAMTHPFDGPEVAAFEDDLMEITGSSHAVATNSGTSAIHLALLTLGVKPGDEVLCPSVTFAATANAISHAGAIPHFIDSRAMDLGINPFKLRQYLGGNLFEERDGGFYNTITNRRVAALCAVHLLGVPCEISGILTTCNAHKIPIVEDACEALGTKTWLGRHAGTIGKIGCFSFNLNKIVTTGGGGALITEDENIASTARHLARQAKVPHSFRWDHDCVGFNYRMPVINAALGLGQLRRLSKTLEAKKAQHARYQHAFKDCRTGFLMDVDGNHWLECFMLDPHFLDARDEVLDALLAYEYEARAIFTPMHMLPHFKDCPRQSSLAGAEDIFRRAICLPSSLGE